jgi:hypothetical protein
MDVLPPQSVKHWIRYNFLGLPNQPRQVVFITTEQFPLGILDKLIILPKGKFDLVAKYGRPKMAGPDCFAKFVLTDQNSVGLGLVEYDEGHAVRCDFLQAPACDFLSGLLNLSGVEWTTDSMQPLEALVNVNMCNAATQLY